jgi:methionyl aminopeptidase
MASGRRCLEAAVANCRAGKRLGDVSHAIERTARADGFQVVREYVGHGIGTKMHEEPQVPNYGPPDRGVKLLAGMTLALEPMVVAGDWHTRVGRDGWTVTTRDGLPAVHFEHTVAVTADGPLVLTRGWEEFA